MLRQIFKSKIDINHLLMNLVGYGALMLLIMEFLAVFVIWGYVGGGEHPKSWNFYIFLAQLGLAIIILYPIILFRVIVNYTKKEYSKAKDLIIVALVILILSLLIAYHDNYL